MKKKFYTIVRSSGTESTGERTEHIPNLQAVSFAEAAKICEDTALKDPLVGDILEMTIRPMSNLNSMS